MLSNSFIPSHFQKMVKGLHEALRDLVAWPNEDTWHFFLHVIHGYRNGLTLRNVDGVAVPWKTIKKFLPKSKTDWLEEQALIHRTGYSDISHECRRYYPSQRVLELLLPLAEEIPSVEDYLSLQKVEPVSGKTKKAPVKSEFTDKNNNAHPKAITNSMNLILNSKINLYALRDHVEHLRVIAKNFTTAENLGRYRSEYWCYEAILNQEPTPTGQVGVWAYNPAYRVQIAGRISEIGGGFQSLSRAGKHCAKLDIKYYNYDLQASQINLLAYLLEKSRIDNSAVLKYLACSKAEKIANYAVPCGLSYDTFKSCLMSLVMGSTPTTGKKGNDYTSSIAIHIAEEVTGDKQIQDAIKAFDNVTSAMSKSIGLWHNQLLARIDNEASKRRAEKYYTNVLGMKVCISDIKTSELKRKLAAYELQGHEASFIHALTVICKANGIGVHANEHDGLITDSEIPEALCHQAANQVAIPVQWLTLVQKPLIDPKALEAYEATRAASSKLPK
jgi:hypothetical protein